MSQQRRVEAQIFAEVEVFLVHGQDENPDVFQRDVFQHAIAIGESDVFRVIDTATGEQWVYPQRHVMKLRLVPSKIEQATAMPLSAVKPS